MRSLALSELWKSLASFSIPQQKLLDFWFENIYCFWTNYILWKTITHWDTLFVKKVSLCVPRFVISLTSLYYAFLLSLFYQTIGPIDSSNSSSSRKLRLRQMFKLSLNRKEKSFRINQSSTLDLKAFTSVAFTTLLGNLSR